MGTLERYILRKTFVPLLAGTSIVLLVLLLERLLRLLDLVVNKGSPISLILKLLLNLAPHYMGMALPAAFFLAMLIAVGRLSTDSELDALQSFGFSLNQVGRPLLLISVLLTALSVAIVGYAQPFSRYAYRALIYAITHASLQYGLEEGVFINTVKDTTLRAERISPDGHQLLNVFVEEDKPTGEQVTTTAREGVLINSPEDLRPILKIYDGVRVTISADKSSVAVLRFDEFNWPLDLASDLSPVRWRGKDERELTLDELYGKLADPTGLTPRAQARYAAELHGRLVRALSMLVLPLLAIPLGITGRRRRRVYGFVIGLVILIVYHNILQFGEELADISRISPWLGLWLPFLALTSLGLYLFGWAAYRIGPNPIAVRLLALEAWARSRMLNLSLVLSRRGGP